MAAEGNPDGATAAPKPAVKRYRRAELDEEEERSKALVTLDEDDDQEECARRQEEGFLLALAEREQAAMVAVCSLQGVPASGQAPAAPGATPAPAAQGTHIAAISVAQGSTLQPQGLTSGAAWRL